MNKSIIATSALWQMMPGIFKLAIENDGAPGPLGNNPLLIAGLQTYLLQAVIDSTTDPKHAEALNGVMHDIKKQALTAASH